MFTGSSISQKFCPTYCDLLLLCGSTTSRPGIGGVPDPLVDPCPLPTYRPAQLLSSSPGLEFWNSLLSSFFRRVDAYFFFVRWDSLCIWWIEFWGVSEYHYFSWIPWWERISFCCVFLLFFSWIRNMSFPLIWSLRRWVLLFFPFPFLFNLRWTLFSLLGHVLF